MTNIQLSARDANQYSPLALAFLGDCVYEKLVRQRYILQGNRPVGQLHSLTIKKVCASYQAKAVDVIMPFLDENETEVLKRGRNATGTTVPKHSSALQYRHATALECLFGFLYLTGRNDRIDELFELIWNLGGEEENE